MKSVSVTFRDQTTGRISDLLDDEHKACAASQNLLAFFAGALLNYTDEGIQFTPSLILCDNIEQILRSFPGAVLHTIGTAPLNPASGSKILKDCGPLSSHNWFIFVERLDTGYVRYGVFTYFMLPTAIPLHEGITIDPTTFCLLIRKVSLGTIELRGSKGNNLTLVFSTVRESVSEIDPVHKFSETCCKDLTESNGFQGYMTRLLESALTESHGTILLCSKLTTFEDISELKDAVEVDPMLDFYKAFSEFQAADTAGAILALQRCEELFRGFLRCDGMIVFDTAGRITAYRMFYKPAKIDPTAANVVGGARRRAFEGVKQLLGEHLVSVLFRSQDGLTLYQGAEA